MIAEYNSASWGGAYTWAKSYIYAGSRLLMTAANNGAGGEALEFHHPDRLGTRMVTNASMNTSFEQSTLPFGTALPAESSGFSNQVFTSYDRSTLANLDYAVNRSYSPGQGRFTQVDPIGMRSAKIVNPQSLNLYAYVQNLPTDLVDPSGLLLAVPHKVCKSVTPSEPGGYGLGEFCWIELTFVDIGNDPPDPSTGGDPGDGGGIGHDAPQPENQTSDDCRIQGILGAIAWAEGAGPTTIVRGRVVSAPDESLVGKRNVVISTDDYSKGHPNIKVRVRESFRFPNGKVGPLNSTAAGMFQIIKPTWDSFGGGSDFSPENQEKVAVKILGSVGAIDPLLKGDLQGAVDRANGQWASLPGSKHGQPTKSFDKFANVYRLNVENCEKLKAAKN